MRAWFRARIARFIATQLSNGMLRPLFFSKYSENIQYFTHKFTSGNVDAYKPPEKPLFNIAAQ